MKNLPPTHTHTQSLLFLFRFALISSHSKDKRCEHSLKVSHVHTCHVHAEQPRFPTRSERVSMRGANVYNYCFTMPSHISPRETHSKPPYDLCIFGYLIGWINLSIWLANEWMSLIGQKTKKKTKKKPEQSDSDWVIFYVNSAIWLAEKKSVVWLADWFNMIRECDPFFFVQWSGFIAQKKWKNRAIGLVIK